jgi:hypothetical protein
MRVDRLFNVLVLGGAAIAASCGDDKSGAAETGTAQGGAGGAAQGGAGGAAMQGGAGGAADDAGVQAGNGGGSDAGGSTVTEGGLACPTPSSPTDPCGCPCCWVANNCINTDKCCEAFTKFCTPP